MTTTLTPAPVRLLNAVGRRTGDLGPLGRLDPDELMEDARRRTGLADLGPDTTEGYTRLIDALDREARLTTLGRLVVGRMARGYLVQRLRVVEALRRRPDLAAAAVGRPLFVVGLPRTGTTLLHNLLSLGPGARPLLTHEAGDPVPAALRGAPVDTRALRYWLFVRGLYYLSPGRRAVHDYEGGPVECLRLLLRSFTTFAYATLLRVPSYEHWLWAQDSDAFVPAYELHKMQLQTLGAGRGRWWVLKAPAHLPTLQALLKVYPDAAVVQTHRDPVKVVGSLSSLGAANRGLLAEPPDPREVGQEVLERTLRTLERAAQARAVVGEDRFADVRYADLLADPVAVLHGVSERFGYPPPAEDRVRRWLAANPQGKHGTHRYALADFGLDPATVSRLTAAYRDRHAIPDET